MKTMKYPLFTLGKVNKYEALEAKKTIEANRNIRARSKHVCRRRKILNEMERQDKDE